MTTLTTRFPTENGVRRLLAAPLDLDAGAGARTIPLAEAPPAYRALFDDYRSALRAAYDVAAPWWEGTIGALEDRGMSRDDAIQESFDRRLAGGASHPRVVRVVREAWLKCAALHTKEAPGVRPEVVLLQWLVDADEQELTRLVACMPYWPIGLDDAGHWC